MSVSFSDSDISAFLSGIINLGGCHIVDESPDKYIRTVSDNEPVTMKVEDNNCPLAIYGTKATDAIIINPLAEGEANSSRSTWFYSTRNIIVSSLIVAIMKELINTALASKKNKKGEEEEMSKNLLASKYLKTQALAIDEKMLKELKLISGEMRNFLNIYYNKTTKIGEVKCVIVTPAQRKAFSSVRVKTWGVFEQLLYTILGVNDLNDLNYKPSISGIPVFECFTNILINIYSRINKPLEILGEQIEKRKLDEVKGHLKYLDAYFARAKWCVSPAVPVDVVSKPADKGRATPWSSNLNPNQPVGYMPQAPAVSKFAQAVPAVAYYGTGVAPVAPMGQPMNSMAPMMNTQYSINQFAPNNMGFNNMQTAQFCSNIRRW